jgi:nitrogen-specific signal transduction histidine kinase
MTPSPARPYSQKYHPSCMLAHELVNKLSVVVGYCDLLKNHAPEDLARIIREDIASAQSLVRSGL